MINTVLFILLAVSGAFMYMASTRKQQKRIRILEQDLRTYADVISKMAEVQTRTYEKFSARFEELDERILNLSIPSQNPEMPLEKRHQILTLARQGASLDDIVKRLKAPRGEAELILNLRKYRNGAFGQAAKALEVQHHA